MLTIVAGITALSLGVVFLSSLSVPVPDSKVAETADPQQGDNVKITDENLAGDDSGPIKLLAGVHFVKRWQVQNTGTTIWTGQFGLVKKSSSTPKGATDDGCPTQIPKLGGYMPILRPGEKGQIAIPVATSNVPGRYEIGYRLAKHEGEEFGDTLWIIFDVKQAPKTVTPTPRPR